MRKDEYINEVISKIENKKARREVEKELSAHIDDRISYYTDAGWDEETANEKAMEHMGKAEEVAEEMGKLHISSKEKCYRALIGLLCIYTALHYIWLVVFIVTDYWETGLEIPKAFPVLTDLIIGVVLFISIVIAHKYKSLSYYLALGLESAILIATIVFPILRREFSPFSLFAGLVIIAIIVLTVISCGQSDTEKERFKDLNKHNKFKKLFEGFLFPAISFYLSVSLVMGFITLFLVVYDVKEKIDEPREKMYNEHVEKVLDDYLANEMPTEVASDEEVKGFNSEDYTRSIGEWDINNLSLEKWNLDISKIKPTKIFPEKYNEENVKYFLTDNEGIILCVDTFSYDFEYYFGSNYKDEIESMKAEDVIRKEYEINRKYGYPDFETAKVSKMLINGVDLAPAFDDDGLEMIRMLINNAEYVKPEEVNHDLKVTGIEWYFEDTPALYNTFGLFMYDYDGNYYFLRALNENVMSPSGEKTRMCSSGLFKVEGEAAETMKKIIDSNLSEFKKGQEDYDNERYWQ